MKKAINLWAFPEDYSMDRCFELAKSAGFEGVELVVQEGRLSPSASDKDVEEIRILVEKKGLKISSLATGLFWDYNLVSADPKKREKAEELIKDMLRMANILGADTILVVPGAVDIPWVENAEKVPYDVALKRAKESVEKVLETAEKLKVNIGLENVWNRLFLSPIEFRDFIDELGSEYVGIYLDVGNIVLTGFPEQWIRIMGERIKKVHLKDFRLSVGNLDGFVGLLEGDVNWPEVMKALKEVNYDGYLVAEVFPLRYHPDYQIFKTSLGMDFIMGRR